MRAIQIGLLLLLAAGLAEGCAASGKAVIDQYQNVTLNRFEGAVAVVLENRLNAAVDDSCESMVWEEFKRVKLMDRKGLDCGPDAPNCRLEEAICYDETFDKVESIEARTITPGGEVVEVKWPKDMSDRQYRPWFTSEGDMRCWVFQMKGGVPGAILEYRARTRQNKLVYLRDLMFQDRDPVIEASVSVDAPENCNYKWKTYNIDIQPVETKKGNRITRVWTAKQLPAIVDEENMVSVSDVAARIGFSADKLHGFGSGKTWEDFANGWWNMIKDVVKPTDKLKEAAKEITKNAKTETEKAKAIWDFMQKNIRYVAVGTGLGGWIPIPAEKVYLDKYGDCKAVAGLISILGREVGLKADPIAIKPRDSGALDRELPGTQFPHSIARVEADGKVYWLDATSRVEGFGSTPAGDQDSDVLVLRPGAPFLDHVPANPPDVNVLTSKFVFIPGENGEMQLEGELSATGNTGSGFRSHAHEMNTQQWNKFIDTILADVYPQASVTEQSQSDRNDNDAPFVVKVKAKIQRALQSTGAGLSFEVKQIYPYRMWNYFKLPKRRYTVDLDNLKTRIDRYEVKVPAGMQPAGLPKNVRFEDEYLKVERLCQIEEDRVVVESTMVLKKLRIPPEKYTAEREVFLKAFDSTSFVLLFEPDKKKKTT